MPEPAFRKSSYSDPEAECVEVATNVPMTVAVRDSKDPDGAALRLRPAAWVLFQAAVGEGGMELDSESG
ncbi:DUF397 domain-containing protein [Streptomyces sp. ISL-12]|uniref:DUF397 domain-containing protein n=1 Tax=Streptomyces sp. ISL-12 TaxID=2819177 RepID=UPI001BEC72E7|nr:DUF397 domain-containing protein [Streptomyces sp. ISL-12]MBT2416139.1 DUF397 domain-containing protein [Streptomyces sp. ISL-12]